MKFCFIFTVPEGVACVMCMLDWVMFPISSAWKSAFFSSAHIRKIMQFTSSFYFVSYVSLECMRMQNVIKAWNVFVCVRLCVSCYGKCSVII